MGTAQIAFEFALIEPKRHDLVGELVEADDNTNKRHNYAHRTHDDADVSHREDLSTRAFTI